MKVLFINIYMHEKNEKSLFKYTNIELYIINNTKQLLTTNFEDYDLIYSPAIIIDARRYPKTRFMFGPHVSVFPDKRISEICGLKNVVYIQPSEWARAAWKNNPICNNLNIKVVPFSVDTDTFSPIEIDETQKNDVFIYFKRRHPMELDALRNFFNTKGIKVRIFDYVQKYTEKDYLNFLQKHAKYGVWLGSHESQGFALQEALSCDVPLLVWNATSMNQEYGGNLPDINCTTVPYWDSRCGEQFSMFYELDRIFEEFIENIETKKYRPREYILENLTTEVCEKYFIDAYDSIESNTQFQ